MIRNVSLDEISDGRLYELNDLVKADCNGCKDCSTCCQGMGKSIILDPYDIYRILVAHNSTFEELLTDKVELNVVDGIILPNLKMTGPAERCSFLNQDGRCSIHSTRPGICRLFPLGRYYENQGFKYFLQVHECPYKNKTKVKVRKWIDTSDIRLYEQYIIDWHYFLKDLQQLMKGSSDDQQAKIISMTLLKYFYLKPYEKEIEFYLQFYDRLSEIKKLINS